MLFNAHKQIGIGKNTNAIKCHIWTHVTERKCELSGCRANSNKMFRENVNRLILLVQV